MARAMAKVMAERAMAKGMVTSQEIPMFLIREISGQVVVVMVKVVVVKVEVLEVVMIGMYEV